MNLQYSISIHSGGPGSGCNPEVGDCGRPSSSEGDTLKAILEKFVPAIGGDKSLWGRLLKYGHQGVVAPFTKEEQVALKKYSGEYKCKIGQCYKNSQRIATDALGDDRVKYMEGLVTVHGIPIGHSWIEFNGKVFDPTLIAKQGFGNVGKNVTSGKPGDIGEYFGVEVPRQLIFKNQFATKMYAPVTEGHYADRVFTQ